jgi:hypothetical protein
VFIAGLAFAAYTDYWNNEATQLEGHSTAAHVIFDPPPSFFFMELDETTVTLTYADGTSETVGRGRPASVRVERKGGND